MAFGFATPNILRQWVEAALPLMKAKTLCLTKGRAFQIPRLWQGFPWFTEGSGNQFLKLNWTFTLLFFPSSQWMCYMCYGLLWLRTSKETLLETCCGRTEQPCSLLGFLKSPRTSYLRHLEPDLLDLPFPSWKGRVRVSCSPRWTNKAGLCYVLELRELFGDGWVGQQLQPSALMWMACLLPHCCF